MTIAIPERRLIKLELVRYPVYVEPFVDGVQVLWDPVSGFASPSVGYPKVNILPAVVKHIRIRSTKPILGDLWCNVRNIPKKELNLGISGGAQLPALLSFFCYEVYEEPAATAKVRIEYLDMVLRDTAGYITKGKSEIEPLSYSTANNEKELLRIMDRIFPRKGTAGVRLRKTNARWQDPEFIVIKPPGWKAPTV